MPCSSSLFWELEEAFIMATTSVDWVLPRRWDSQHCFSICCLIPRTRTPNVHLQSLVAAERACVSMWEVKIALFSTSNWVQATKCSLCSTFSVSSTAPGTTDMKSLRLHRPSQWSGHLLFPYLLSGEFSVASVSNRYPTSWEGEYKRLNAAFNSATL